MNIGELSALYYAVSPNVTMTEQEQQSRFHEIKFITDASDDEVLAALKKEVTRGGLLRYVKLTGELW